MFSEKYRPYTILAIIIALLLIPLLAMQFTQEVQWSGYDFLVMGVLLLLIGIACEVILRKVSKLSYRILLCAIAFVIYLLIWAELAVGIFGSPFAGS